MKEKKEPIEIKWVNSLPSKPGAYVIETMSAMSNKRRLEAKFDGKSFDISNQVFVAYLNEEFASDDDNKHPQLNATWSRGKSVGSIVSDCGDGIKISGAGLDPSDRDYYGGYLVGESMSESLITLILEMHKTQQQKNANG
jgi:hypothetical protein